MSETCWHVLRAVKVLGVRIAIDDFGTGYASLAYLNERVVDTLKIDRSFLADDSEELLVARSIVQLGRSLHLDVVAKGVEKDTQARILLAAGCTRAQGCLYSRPSSGRCRPRVLPEVLAPPHDSKDHLRQADAAIVGWPQGSGGGAARSRTSILRPGVGPRRWSRPGRGPAAW